MASGGSWDPTNLPVRPGLYSNFVSAAIAQITGGPRGIVGIPLKQYGSAATEKTFYIVSTEKEAIDNFGSANIASIKLALQAGAREVLVYTLPTIDGTDVTEEIAYADAFDAFEARDFNVFVFDGEVEDATQDSALAWVKRNRSEGKHFLVVFGGTDATDADPAQGDARSTRLDDDYSVNLTVGGTVGDKTYNSSQYAPYIAGLIAGKAINQSITYAKVSADDVNKRLRNSEIEAAIKAGSLVLVNDGAKVKVETGITTSGAKIRSVRTRQAIATDLTRSVADNYIGQVDNNADGQAALISACSAYLERLENANALRDPIVQLDPDYPSVGDKVFLLISYIEVDSMERIFITVRHSDGTDIAGGEA